LIVIHRRVISFEAYADDHACSLKNNIQNISTSARELKSPKNLRDRCGDIRPGNYSPAVGYGQ